MEVQGPVSLTPRLVNAAVNYVEECEDWVANCHPGARISHDLLDALSHFRLIAMNQTIGASWLRVAKRAFVEPQKSVSLQISALITKAR